jgi:hypothetical protein
MPADPVPESIQTKLEALISSRVPTDRREAFARYLERRASPYLRERVGIIEFVESPEYLGRGGELYPKVMEALSEMTSGRYQEAVLTGAIGTAKSTLAVYSMTWSLYQLSTLRDPHAEFGLDPTSEIVIVFQSINARTAKSVDFERFKALIDGSRYFQTQFSYDPRVESELRFPNRIIVRPVTGDVTGAIGQNVIGGVIDEVNHMAKVSRSTRSADGGEFDQAVALYNSIVRRRKSRFMRRGRLPGLLCLVGSKRYPGQFTDQRVAAAQTDPTIYVYDKRTWEVLPEDRFSGDWFDVFVGDCYRQPRILAPGETLPDSDQPLILRVPTEYRDDFMRDIHESLREIGGISTLAAHPFFSNREAVAACLGRRRSIVSRTQVEFSRDKLAALPDRFEHPDLPRWVHVDLALTGDAAGIACGFVPGFIQVARGSASETLPRIAIDFTLRVVPPSNGEISFERIRQLIYKLTELGLAIRWVSFDGFQSADSIQQLRMKGYQTGIVSVDRTTDAYEVLKSAIYDGRVLAPTDEHLMGELLALEMDHERGKVDHPSAPGASKDVADCLAALVQGLSRRRETWARHGVPLSAVPVALLPRQSLPRDAMSL